ncbi:MAG: hypothetical protein RJA22_1744 [Verrucomicrobiota bacterium]
MPSLISRRPKSPVPPASAGPRASWRSRAPARPRLGLLAALGALLGLAEPPAAPAAPPIRGERLLIQPQPGQEPALAGLHANLGARVHRRLARLANLEVIELPPGADPVNTLDRYRRSGAVAAADLDYVRWQPAAMPNEPAFASGQLWHLQNTGSSGGLPGADIDAPAAWDRANTASKVIVAVVDTGIHYTHEDLAANMWTNPGESGEGRETNGLDDDGNGYVDDVHGINAASVVAANSGQPLDDWFGHGHGTHVAGILGAVGNNGVGVCGIAWQVRLMALKFISTSGGSDSDLVECLNYALDRGASVINASIVGGGPPSTLLSNAFWNVRQAGVVVVAAAGNNGTDNDVTPYYPAGFRLDNLLAVTATTRTDGWAGYNYGATSVHLAAPGYEILSTGRSADNDYFLNYGTSMATPMVAGAAALLRGLYPSDSPQQLIARLLRATDPLPSLAGRCVTGGRLNLQRALNPATVGTFSAATAGDDWIPTNGLTRLTFSTSDGVSGPHLLTFPFPLAGETRDRLWVGANGLAGFTNTGLSSGINLDLPLTNLPNAILCPYWDDLNPLAGGDVWFGNLGAAPHRKAVVTWSRVPHQSTAGGGATFTFQAILHESGHVAFQYLEVESGAAALTQGRSATIGVEDSTGLFGARWSLNGSPTLVTNGQALLFTPATPLAPAPALTIAPGPLPGLTRVVLAATPGQPATLLASTNLTHWTALETNTIPASGQRSRVEPNSPTESRRFFRALTPPAAP